jgi:hypothetical protein
MSKTPEELRKFLKDTFGEFGEFKKQFFNIKFGALPPVAHPHPRTISKIQKMEDWPVSFRVLKDLYAICFECKYRGIFAGCKMCPKIIAGECEGLYNEAGIEESRLLAKQRQKKRKGGRKK